ncbi:Type II inositol 3,4-bisphosphate 4-phosphatase [Bagarius yarrelli]|uniref:Type II inositol 3,4-bisphosphate 4-phosphatase n=1 Tax=Bagarius yarrelli TaxID=175774 RepID=A0A556TM90_BAGYA|nr:Type II inositol 3,4-bisphosphate 4-phosphatase [Bagarius yarrelli]
MMCDSHSRFPLCDFELSFQEGPSFKPSCSKAQKYLEFIPINLHTQRMRVMCPTKTDSFYDVITVGAPAAHFQGFKNGGLQKLLNRYEAEKKRTTSGFVFVRLANFIYHASQP